MDHQIINLKREEQEKEKMQNDNGSAKKRKMDNVMMVEENGLGSQMRPLIPFLLFLPSSLAFLQSLLCPCNRGQCQQSSLPLCQSHCASSCGGGQPAPAYSGYGSSFGSSYLPSAYQPPTVYRPLQQLQQPQYHQQQPQPTYNSYALPRPVPPPPAPPLNIQPLQQQIAVEPAAVSPYASQHPTLLQQTLEPSEYPTSLPAHPPDFDSSAAVIQYSMLKRGEGRSLRGAKLGPKQSPFSPENEESFEDFERAPSKRAGNEFEEKTGREEELYDDAVTASGRENEIAFHAPRGVEEEREEVPSAAEGEEDEALANILKEEAETKQASLLGRGFKMIKWAAIGHRKKKDNHEAAKEEQEQMGSAPKHKCNNVELRRIMEEKMVGSPSASKQLVYSAVRAAFGRSPDVICSRSSFSYIVVSSPVYCEHKKAPSTCFVYFQP